MAYKSKSQLILDTLFRIWGREHGVDVTIKFEEGGE